MPKERPILRLPDPRDAFRQPGPQPRLAPPRGPGRRRQGERLGPSFDELTQALRRAEGRVELVDNPASIAPERALVFETAGNIQDFARAARAVNLEVIAEIDLDDTADIPEGFTPSRGQATMPQALYATMPIARSANQILALWRAYQADRPAPNGAAPWWRMFDRLIKLRVWGPEDRFPMSARQVLESRLQGRADDDVVNVELEIWPSADQAARDSWRRETEQKVRDLGGQRVDQSSIAGENFVYEAILASLPVLSVRELIANPATAGGLAWVRGVQFILPQTVAQGLPAAAEEDNDVPRPLPAFDAAAPFRVALFDGTPVAAHPALDRGVVVEDIHDLVRLSMVNQRAHATSMASLILRSDLQADGTPVPGSRLLCVPVMVDGDRGAFSPQNKLFVDVLHVALTRLFVGNNALAPDAFVVNLSVGVPEMRFAGRISSLARLLDWWSNQHGVLFVVSAGNVFDDFIARDVEPARLLAADVAALRKAIKDAVAIAGYGRTLMAPAEALNVLSVGAISEDLLAPGNAPRGADIVQLEADGSRFPAVSSALGLGPFRSVKPDVLVTGGTHEVRAVADGNHTKLSVVLNSPSGLVGASPRLNVGNGRRRSRGTSCAAALTTRAVLQSAEAMTEEGGPYDGAALSRMDLALLTRALCVNAADWSNEALTHYDETADRLGRNKVLRCKEEVARHFGYGYLFADRMQQSPAQGVTLVGLGDVRKDQGKIFDMPLPPSLSGDRVPRSMRVTLAWFSPATAARSRYRLAALRAIAADVIEDDDQDEDKGWGLLLKAAGPDRHMIRRGTVWSRRLVHGRLAGPAYDEDVTIPIRVQCQDASGGGLHPDLDIRFAIAVTLEIEAEVNYDIHAEIREKIDQRARAAAGVRV